jgi:hypothetical protein
MLKEYTIGQILSNLPFENSNEDVERFFNRKNKFLLSEATSENLSELYSRDSTSFFDVILILGLRGRFFKKNFTNYSSSFIREDRFILYKGSLSKHELLPLSDYETHELSSQLHKLGIKRIYDIEGITIENFFGKMRTIGANNQRIGKLWNELEENDFVIAHIEDVIEQYERRNSIENVQLSLWNDLPKHRTDENKKSNASHVRAKDIVEQFFKNENRIINTDDLQRLTLEQTITLEQVKNYPKSHQRIHTIASGSSPLYVHERTIGIGPSHKQNIAEIVEKELMIVEKTGDPALDLELKMKLPSFRNRLPLLNSGIAWSKDLLLSIITSTDHYKFATLGNQKNVIIRQNNPFGVHSLSDYIFHIFKLKSVSPILELDVIKEYLVEKNIITLDSPFPRKYKNKILEIQLLPIYENNKCKYVTSESHIADRDYIENKGEGMWRLFA